MDPTTAVVVAVHLQHLTDRTTPAVPGEGQIVCVIQVIRNYKINIPSYSFTPNNLLNLQLIYFFKLLRHLKFTLNKQKTGNLIDFGFFAVIVTVTRFQGTHPLRRLASEVAVLILSTLEVLTANKKTVDPPSDPADLAAQVISYFPIYSKSHQIS